MNINLKELEVAVVLPVFSADTSFLSVINSNCIELVEKMPGVNWTFIIINDGSQALPSENNLFQNLSANIRYQYYHNEANMGKGYAVRFGFFKAAEADIFIYTDYDFPFGTNAVMDAVNILGRNEADIVAADRGSGYFSFLPFSRRIITRLTRIINSSILKLNFTDTQAGLKGMNNRGLTVMLHTSINSFLFDLQFIRNAEQQRLRIHPLAVKCTENIQLKSFRFSVICKEIKQLFILLFESREKEKAPSSFSEFRGVRYSSEIPANSLLENIGQEYCSERTI